MTDVDEKIKKLGKMVKERPAPYHIQDLINEIKQDIEKSDIVGKDNYKVLLDSMDTLLKRSIPPIADKKKDRIDRLEFINKED